MEYNLYISAKREIVNKLKELFKRYNEKDISFEELKKWIIKKNNFKNILNDINNTGYHYFNSDTGYENFVKELIYEVLNDLIAKEKDNKKEEKTMINENEKIRCRHCGYDVIFKSDIGSNMFCPNCNQIITNYIKEVKKFTEFDNFKLINEVNLPIMKIDELTDSIPMAKPSHKYILSYKFKIPNDYIDTVSKKNHHYKVNDMRGDILGNSRVVFDAYVYNIEDINRIKENIIDFCITDFMNQLPENLNIFGIDIAPVYFINKEELKLTFEGIITNEKTLNIISEILNFDLQKTEDFYIWTNKSKIGKK